jgi:inhibitor of KinA sporulation pathway (predicted exonuclease)
MAKKLDRILVIDVEATCWPGVPPAGMNNDIIEIGIVPVEVTSLIRLEKRSILVCPERSTVSEFCTQLTTLTPKMVSGGVTLQQACRILKNEYLSQDRVWASYGDYDRKQFERQCREMEIPYPFGPTHLNVKTLLALTQNWPQEVGMKEALEKLGISCEGTHHRGHDDAWNIAQLLVKVLTLTRAG